MPQRARARGTGALVATKTGIGFNFGVGYTNVDHGFTSFEADTYDD